MMRSLIGLSSKQRPTRKCEMTLSAGAVKARSGAERAGGAKRSGLDGAKHSVRICERVGVRQSVFGSRPTEERVCRRQVSERNPTGSRDVSDARTDPGAGVPGLRVGSLTSRLLFAPLGASAQTADAM